MDWASVANTFVATLPATITAIGGLIVIIRKLNIIHETTNSLAKRAEEAAAELGRLEGNKAGHAEGVADEKAAQGSTRRTIKRSTPP